MELVENASLVLRTFDILQNNTVAATDNAIGTIAGNNAYITWKNINLRQVIGQNMYEKYDKFNLCLSCYAMRPPANVVQTAYRNASIWISGLNWSNQSYNILTKSNTVDTCFGVVTFSAIATDPAILSLTNAVATFNKPSNEIVNITIEFKHNTVNSQDGYTEKPNTMLGHHTFVFDIVGCQDYQRSDLTRRF